MRRSKLFLPTLKENPSEASINSHRLMLRAGMIRQSSSGIYTWLPLGYKVLRNIEKIIRFEQNLISQELLMPTIQDSEIWKKSGRFNDYGKEMLKFKDRHEHELLYGPTNEELITDIFSKNIMSYKSLPLCLYHIQWKFRDEIRPRFGVMRGREFLMKDAYSFDKNKDDAIECYNRMFLNYLRIFDKMELKAILVAADTGPIGGELSHEFIILAETGESDVFIDKNILNEEIPNSFYPYQYDNLSNRRAHYESTGPEIWEQTAGKVTHFVVGVGTGGTISGVGNYLKEQNPAIKVWGIDTYGSVFKKYHETGEFDEKEIYSYITEGIGEDILPKNVDFDVIDYFEKVTDKDGAVATRELAKKEGLFLGYSCGSAFQGLRPRRSCITKVKKCSYFI